MKWNTYTKKLFNLKDHVIVITGGAGLLGSSYAEVVCEYGGKPVLLDVNRKRLGEVVKKTGGRAISFVVDITQKNEVEKVSKEIIERFGKIDALINNAAIDPKVSKDPVKENWSMFENFPLEHWNNELSVGLTGAFIASQVFGKEMAKRGAGVILNISSDLGIIAPDQDIYRKKGEKRENQNFKPVTYSVIKHGMIGLTKYLATYYGGAGIRVNAIAPGGVYNDQPEDFIERLTKLIPLGRMAHGDEYKGIVLFLISGASHYLTGATLVIDGGRTCR